eukprot:COSAG02_NODE_13231_length_1422_cov_1.532880_3_plen_93_part_00
MLMTFLLAPTDPCSKMTMPLVAAMIVSGGRLRRVYYLSTTLAAIDVLIALLGPETLPVSERKPFQPRVSCLNNLVEIILTLIQSNYACAALE